MKKLLIITALATATLAPAQPQNSDRFSEEQIATMRDRLKLTPEQVEKVKPILAKQAEKMQELRPESNDNRSRRDRMKLAQKARDIQKETEAELKGILTPEQMREFAAIRDERRDRIRGQRNR